MYNDIGLPDGSFPILGLLEWLGSKYNVYVHMRPQDGGTVTRLWRNERMTLGYFLQSRVSQLFGVDIHPAAKIGRGIMMDHASGIVIGETAVVEDDVSMLHGVTLGGSGKEKGDRHPKIRRGVLLSAGAKVLGNIEVGEYSRVGAGSVVLAPVPAHCTVAGVPARVVGCAGSERPSQTMDQQIAPIEKKS